MNRPLILGIETSCDETSVAIVDGQHRVLAHVTASQISHHAGFGGVFPELASRLHTENMTYVLAEVFHQAQCSYQDLQAVAVTRGPGLIGALHIGLQAAKVIASIATIPLLAVHHHAAHLLAGNFTSPIRYPALGLIISGGHTQLVLLEKPLRYQVIGQTQDDAVGESYDKVARMLGLGYPGGPLIDALAQQGKEQYRLPTPTTLHPFDFSFSGLKTAVSQLIHREGSRLHQANLAYAFQKIVVDTLVEKSQQAMARYPVQSLIVGGGVSLNQSLRKAFAELERKLGIPVIFPPAWACTDNGAMIALMGQVLYQQQQWAPLSIGVDPSWDLQTFPDKLGII